MQFEFGWLEVVAISGLILLALGPERLLEVWDDFAKLWNDFRAYFVRKKA
jgi:hypothetical protein